MSGSFGLRVVGALAASLTVLAVILTAGASTPAPGPFEDTWARTDLPVQQGRAQRTWIWAPAAFTGVISEPYAESPDGLREVQYFDKSRMEITNPDGDSGSPWHVTNGLLVLEMVEGYIQTGASESEQRDPSRMPVAGDLEGEGSPTYATVALLMDLPSGDEGAAITRRVDAEANVTGDPSLAQHGVAAGPSAGEYGREHRTASVFWEFMNASGAVWDGESFVEARLFENPYYATGLPIAPAFWTTVSVGGTPKDVLFQCFERRCLTYTPDNPEDWRVEAGNVGLHYYAWRYPAQEDPAPPLAETTTDTPPTATATEPGQPPAATATSTSTPTPQPTATNTSAPAPPAPPASPTATATATSTATATATATTPSGGGSAAVCLNAAEAAFLNLINQYRGDHGLQPLAVSAALNVASYNHSLDMSQNSYFDHYSQNGDSPWDRMAAAGYDYNTHKGENIAMGYSTAQAVFDGWRNSPGHNANMLNSNFRAIGIGYVSNGHYWTTDFGGVVDAPPSC